MTSLKALLILISWACTSAALWSEEPPRTNGETARPRIVVLGDSITAGFGIEPAQAYPALLQAKIDQAGLLFEVANAGVSGDTTAGGLRRVDWVLGRGAAVLIVALGGNDGLRGIPPKQMEENLRAIIGRAREKIPSIAIIVAGMEMPATMGEAYVLEYRKAFSKVASETGAEFIPFLLEGVAGVPELNQADAMHPNPAGHKILAENVWKALDKVLKAKRP